MTSSIPTRRRWATGAAAVLALILAGCAEPTAGSGTRAAAGSPAATSGASPAGGTAAGPARTISELVAQLIAGTAHGTTVHMEVQTDSLASGHSFSADMRTKAGGAPDAMSLSIHTGGESIAMVYVDGRAYVKPPASSQADPNRPWLTVTATSSNPVAQDMAHVFDSIGQRASLAQYARLLGIATHFGATGATSVNGVPGQGYSFDLDLSKLPNASSLPAGAGTATIPTTIVVDAQGRPLRMVEKIVFSGQSSTITVTMSNYDKPVTITAPPPSQIGG